MRGGKKVVESNEFGSFPEGLEGRDWCCVAGLLYKIGTSGGTACGR